MWMSMHATGAKVYSFIFYIGDLSYYLLTQCWGVLFLAASGGGTVDCNSTH